MQENERKKFMPTNRRLFKTLKKKKGKQEKKKKMFCCCMLLWKGARIFFIFFSRFLPSTHSFHHFPQAVIIFVPIEHAFMRVNKIVHTDKVEKPLKKLARTRSLVHFVVWLHHDEYHVLRVLVMLLNLRLTFVRPSIISIIAFFPFMITTTIKQCNVIAFEWRAKETLKSKKKWK